MIGPVFLQDWVGLLEANLKGRNVPVTGVSTDTRTLQPGDVFVALVGQRYDGHQFVGEAQQRGACAVVVSEPVTTLLPQLQVKDTLAALTLLAGWNRQRFEYAVIGVTGSSGKTTVKEMIAAILRQQGDAHATSGNFNNHIGVPLTLLCLAHYHTAAVVELGASKPEDIAKTAAIVQPQVAVITNVSEAHIEGFGDLAVTVRTKGDLLEYLQQGGTAVLNADSPYFNDWRKRLRQDITLKSFALKYPAEVTATEVTVLEGGEHSFKLNIQISDHKTLSEQVHLHVPGVHSIANALAAAAATHAVGMTAKAIKRGLESFSGVAGRLTERMGTCGCLVIVDTYNANPASMRVAIEVACETKKNTILVIGDMGELGEEALHAHADVGAYAVRKGIAQLLAVGEYSRAAVEAFGVGGHWFASQASLIKYLKECLGPEHLVVVKGSRSAQMNLVIEALVVQQES